MKAINKKMKAKNYYCKKRKIYIDKDNYCDWFSLRRSGLRKRNCTNCKNLTDEKIDKNKQNTKGKDYKSTKNKSKTKGPPSQTKK